MKELKTSYILIFVVIAMFSACEYNFITPDTGEPVDPEVPISFSSGVEPIWTSQSCVNCHNGDGVFSLKPGEAYQSLISNNLLELDNAENSLIIKVPGTRGTHANLTYVGNQKLLIITWIKQGAKDN